MRHSMALHCLFLISPSPAGGKCFAEWIAQECDQVCVACIRKLSVFECSVQSMCLMQSRRVAAAEPGCLVAEPAFMNSHASKPQDIGGLVVHCRTG